MAALGQKRTNHPQLKSTVVRYGPKADMGRHRMGRILIAFASVVEFINRDVPMFAATKPGLKLNSARSVK